MAYIKNDGTIGYDDIFNYVKPQTQAEIEARQAEAQAQAETKADHQLARTALLARLGITSDEAKLVFG